MNNIYANDLFPYEIPFFLNKNGICNLSILYSEYNILNKYKPFTYNIPKLDGKNRLIGIAHPVFYIKISQFFDSYCEEIINLCKYSIISLRFPYIKSNNIRSKFFAYERFTFLHKFLDSKEYLENKKKFKYIYKFDIEKCFNNINIELLKTYDCYKKYQPMLDEMIELVKVINNYENGILVGSEFSRIVAEVFLQQLDSELITSLKLKDIIFNNDFIINRYVDDYYIFYNDQVILPTILDTTTKILNDAGLRFNINKTFTNWYEIENNLKCAKKKLSLLIKSVFNKFRYRKIEPNYVFEILITEIKKIILQYNVKAAEVSNLVMFYCTNYARIINDDILNYWLEISIKINLFFLSVAPKFRSVEYIRDLSLLFKNVNLEDCDAPKVRIEKNLLDYIQVSINKVGLSLLEINILLILDSIYNTNKQQLLDRLRSSGAMSNINNLNAFQLITIIMVFDEIISSLEFKLITERIYCIINSTILNSTEAVLLVMLIFSINNNNSNKISMMIRNKFPQYTIIDKLIIQLEDDNNQYPVISNEGLIVAINTIHRNNDGY